MRFKQQLQPGILIKRYKRFLADVEVMEGVLTVHCPNSGSMLGCSDPGSPVRLSRSENPNRKYAHTLEMVKAGPTWVGVNTSLTNKLVREALENGVISDFGRQLKISQEVTTSADTRLDFFLESKAGRVYMEVKNCSLADNRRAMFPDAVTVRGRKHLHALADLKQQGHGAAVLFCIQREDADIFSPAAHIDPLYAETLAEVAAKGVLVLAYQARVRLDAIEIAKKIPVDII